MFFEVKFVAGPPPVLGKYELTTAVRQEKEVVINLANPLDSPVTMQARCDNAEVSVETNYELRARGETGCRAVYRPLLPCEGETARLTFSSEELGDFVYELALKAAPAGTERQMQFKAALGTAAKQTFRFRHLAPAPCAYTCLVDSDVFAVDPQVSAPAAPDAKGVEVEVEVTFDPDRIGEAAARLTVTSDAGGEYVCLLSGHGLPPQPLGPTEVAGRVESSLHWGSGVRSDARGGLPLRVSGGLERLQRPAAASAPSRRRLDRGPRLMPGRVPFGDLDGGPVPPVRTV